MSSIVEKVKSLGHVPVLPLMGCKRRQNDKYDPQTEPDRWGKTQLKTLRALRDRFQPDGMCMLMDLTVEAEAMGLPVEMGENESPHVSGHDIKTMEDLEAVKSAWTGNGGRMDMYVEVVKNMAADNRGVNHSLRKRTLYPGGGNDGRSKRADYEHHPGS